jgi:hypothetical protein
MRGNKGKEAESAGDPHRPRRGFAARGTARPRAAGWPRIGPGEDPRQERKVIDASPAAITLAMLLTDEGRHRQSSLGNDSAGSAEFVERGKAD